MSANPHLSPLPEPCLLRQQPGSSAPAPSPMPSSPGPLLDGKLLVTSPAKVKATAAFLCLGRGKPQAARPEPHLRCCQPSAPRSAAGGCSCSWLSSPSRPCSDGQFCGTGQCGHELSQTFGPASLHCPVPALPQAEELLFGGVCGTWPLEAATKQVGERHLHPMLVMGCSRAEAAKAGTRLLREGWADPPARGGGTWMPLSWPCLARADCVCTQEGTGIPPGRSLRLRADTALL